MKTFWLVACPDNMDHWMGDIPERAGQIWTVYIIDPNVKTHCCEITPSYWLEYLDSFFENDIDDDNAREKLEDEIRTAQANCEPSGYWHCSQIDPLFKPENKKSPKSHIWRKGNPALIGWQGEFDDIEAARDYWQGNPPFPPIDLLEV